MRLFEHLCDVERAAAAAQKRIDGRLVYGNVERARVKLAHIHDIQYLKLKLWPHLSVPLLHLLDANRADVHIELVLVPSIVQVFTELRVTAAKDQDRHLSARHDLEQEVFERVEGLQPIECVVGTRLAVSLVPVGWIAIISWHLL